MKGGVSGNFIYTAESVATPGNSSCQTSSTAGMSLDQLNKEKNTYPFQSFYRKQNKTKKQQRNKKKNRTFGKSDQLNQPKKHPSHQCTLTIQPKKKGVLPIELGLPVELSYSLALLSPLTTRSLALCSRKTQVEITSKGFLMT